MQGLLHIWGAGPKGRQGCGGPRKLELLHAAHPNLHEPVPCVEQRSVALPREYYLFYRASSTKTCCSKKLCIFEIYRSQEHMTKLKNSKFYIWQLYYYSTQFLTLFKVVFGHILSKNFRFKMWCHVKSIVYFSRTPLWIHHRIGSFLEFSGTSFWSQIFWCGFSVVQFLRSWELMNRFWLLRAQGFFLMWTSNFELDALISNVAHTLKSSVKVPTSKLDVEVRIFLATELYSRKGPSKAE